ncbi:hypothetical protein [Streptomyces sp. NBC_00009]|uniref:hypothetical protein n=1 Tax=Streptomyces sp. NBC_00009 TaxID=2975620 RepID=UPI00324E5855
MQRTRPRLLHGTLINRYGFTGRRGRPFGDNGIGHLRGFNLARHGTSRLRGITGSFSSHHLGNGRAVTGTIIGTRARNRRPVTRALTVPGQDLCGIGPIP